MSSLGRRFPSWGFALFLVCLGAEASVSVSFKDGLSPSTSYVGTSDVPLQNGEGIFWEPTVNYDTTVLKLDGSPWDQVSLLKFDLSSIPTHANVTAVELVFFVLQSGVATYELRRLLRPFHEQQATWNQASVGVDWQTPGAQGAADIDSIALGQVVAASTGTQTTPFNASGVAVVDDWVANPANNFGLGISNLTTSDGLILGASNRTAGSERPMLRVTYDTGGAPTTASFRNGLSGYLGTTDVVLGNGPNPQDMPMGTESYLCVDDGKVVLFRFDLSSIPPWATVQEAQLKLTTLDASPNNFNAYPLLRSWGESTATWNLRQTGVPWSAPGAHRTTDIDTTTTLATFTAPGPLLAEVTAPLTTTTSLMTVQGWIANPASNLGYALLNPAATNNFCFGARNRNPSSARPAMTVTYTEGRLVFEGATGATLGQPLQTLTLRRESLAGTEVSTGAPALNVTLASSSPTGRFIAPEGGSPVTTLALSIAADQARTPPFSYLDETLGTATLTVEVGPEWDGSTKDIQVVPAIATPCDAPCQEACTPSASTECIAPPAEEPDLTCIEERQACVRPPLDVGCGCQSAPDATFLYLALLVLATRNKALLS